MGSLMTSKPMTSHGRVGLGLTGSQQPSRARDACRRQQLRDMTDLRCERQLESTISRTAAAIATPLTISTNPRMLDSARIVTPVTWQAIPEILIAVPQEVNQSTTFYALEKNCYGSNYSIADHNSWITFLYSAIFIIRNADRSSLNLI